MSNPALGFAPTQTPDGQSMLREDLIHDLLAVLLHNVFARAF
jgi:hypothetical protein